MQVIDSEFAEFPTGWKKLAPDSLGYEDASAVMLLLLCVQLRKGIREQLLSNAVSTTARSQALQLRYSGIISETYVLPTAFAFDAVVVVVYVCVILFSFLLLYLCSVVFCSFLPHIIVNKNEYI